MNDVQTIEGACEVLNRWGFSETKEVVLFLVLDSVKHSIVLICDGESTTRLQFSFEECKTLSEAREKLGESFSHFFRNSMILKVVMEPGSLMQELSFLNTSNFGVYLSNLISLSAFFDFASKCQVHTRSKEQKFDSRIEAWSVEAMDYSSWKERITSENAVKEGINVINRFKAVLALLTDAERVRIPRVNTQNTELWISSYMEPMSSNDSDNRLEDLLKIMNREHRGKDRGFSSGRITMSDSWASPMEVEDRRSLYSKKWSEEPESREWGSTNNHQIEKKRLSQESELPIEYGYLLTMEQDTQKLLSELVRIRERNVLLYYLDKTFFTNRQRKQIRLALQKIKQER